MQVLYKEKPHMGDIHQVEAQMAKVNQELDFLTGEISKFKNYLTEASSQVNMPITAALSAAGSSNSVGSPSVHGTRRKSPGHRGSTSSASAVPQTGIHQRSSFSEDSLSSGSSMGHQHSHTEPNLGVGLGSGLKSSPKRSSEGKIATEIREGTPPQPTYGSSTSPESGIGGETSQLSFVDGGDVNDGSLYNECAPLPILGTGTALYTFDGCSDGTIPMREGEELLLIEKDEGDGWTRVRKVGGTEEEGFVPTSYLEMKFYPT